MQHTQFERTQLRSLTGMTNFELVSDCLTAYLPVPEIAQTNLVFIDTNIEDYEILLKGLLPGVQVFLLTPEQDGVEQIHSIISEFSALQSVHIVSHGSPACLSLGSTLLSIDNLDQYAKRLGQWSQFFGDDGRIFLYGCRVAEGEVGLAFVRQFHETTGVAIAASSTLTGHTSQGGNWQLDATTEPMDISLPFTAQALESFGGVLHEGHVHIGAAIFSINLGSNDIQKSNFGTNSFLITNTGDKVITKVEIDVTGALYPDSVFDPTGAAGDTASKALTINTDGLTGVVSPSSYNPYVGIGGTSGYEGLILLFDSTINGGFNPSETVGFSIDMDPNSVAGSTKSLLDGGSSPSWDVGGVSGAELIGSIITITFDDGTTATGQLMGDGTLAGSQALVSQASPSIPVTLTVNGLSEGGVGTYSAGGPSVIINGPAGQTARVVLTKGFIQPVTNLFYSTNPTYAAQLDAQLAALADSNFPANNAVEFQTVDILLTGQPQDISSLFNFSGVAAYNFVGEDQLPLGFVASIIDLTNQNLAIGPVTEPIYLAYNDVAGPAATIDVGNISISESGLTSYSFTVAYSDGSGVNTATLGNDDVVVTGPNGYTANATFVSSTVGTGGSIIATYSVIPPGGSWSSADNGTYTVTVQAGSVTDGVSNGVGTVQKTFTADLTSPPPTQPIRIQAEDYKTGGQGISYFDTTAGNQYATYRSDDVDIQATGDVGGGFNIGAIKNNEWLTYDVTIPASGLYDLVLRVATPQSSTKNIRVTIAGQVVNLSFTNTGGWQKYQDVIATGVNLPAGTFTMRVDLLSSDLNFNYIEFRPAGTAPNTAPTTTGITNVTVVENAPNTEIDLYAAFADAQTADSGLTYTVVGNSNPSLFTGTTVNASTGKLILDYAPTGTGTSNLTVRATDPQGAFVDTTFTVTVNAPAANTAPTTTGIANVTVVENAPNTEIDLYAAFADAQTADSGLTYTVVGNSNPSLFTGTTINAATGKLTLDYAPTGTGTSNLTVRATDPQGAFVDTTFTVTVNPPPTVPSGQPIRIQAEDYKVGGQNVSYFDTTAGNQYAAYRSDDVDIQATGDVGGGFNIGAVKNGEWLTYDVTIPESGLYDLVLRVATPQSSTKNIRVTIAGQVVNLSFTNTGGWQKYQDVIATGVNLPAGTHTMRVDLLSSDLNFNYIEFRPVGAVTNTPPTTTGITNVTVVENAPNTEIDLYAAFADAQTADSGLTYAVVGNTNSALFTGTTINATGKLVLDYAPTGTGTANLTVRATDPQGAFVDTTFTVTVNAPATGNTAPTTTGIANVTVVENAPNTEIDLYAAFADAQTADSGLTYTVVGNSNPALFTAATVNAATGKLILDYASAGTGTSNLTVRATDPQGAFVDTTFAVTVNPNNNQLLRIQAEDYRLGGQGVAYYDDTTGNQFGQYRTDDVDIEKAGDTGGGFNIGAIKPGEWLTYEVNLAQPGLFKLVARVATNQNDTKTIKATLGGISNTTTFSYTGGWQKYIDVTVIPEVSLSAGTHILRFDSSSASFNLNYFDLVSLVDVTSPTASMPPAPSDITIANGSKGNYTLTVNYADNVAIDPATLDGSEIVITGPNGFSVSPTLVSLAPNATGSALQATYAVAPPGGTWDFVDEGDYIVTLLSNKVKDTSGLSVAGSTLGSFPVTIENQDHFLHVVINAPQWVIDYDGDGDELIPLQGHESHTHEFGAFLTDWTWTNGTTVLGTGPSITTTLGVGTQEVTLTIGDNKGQTLTDSSFINVYPLNAVGGILTKYYTTGGAPVASLLDTLPATPGFIEVQSDLSVDETDNTLGASPYTGDVVAVLTGDFVVDASGSYTFDVTGDVDSRLYINGALVSGAISLTAGTTYDLEVRVARAGSETAPVQVLASMNGGLTSTVFTPSKLTHDQTTLAPFINRMPVQGSEFGGEVIVLEGIGFFEGEAANQVSVKWGNTTLSGSQLQISQGQIRFLAPPGTGTVSVTVTTPNGTSAPASYSYNPSVVPIDFTDPKVVANVAAPTQAAWGPDGRLYVASVIGTVTALEFDDNYNLLTTQSIAGVSGLSASNILGIAFNPFDSVPKIYIAHSKLFPGETSAYVGYISVLEGPNFSTLTTLVSGLPVSNHDHGINGMAFDNNGDLLVAVGGNTNAGIVSDKMGWLPESPLSGAILKVHLTDPTFNGNITYLERGTGIQKPLQIDGANVDVAPGVDVTVFSPGHRNPYDIVFTTKGLLYGTDNGPNTAFGAASTSATTQTTGGVGAPDELNLIFENHYYGHPNRNRGFYDDRQNVYYSPSAQEIPGIYDSPLSTLGSSSNGIDEYRSMAFKGQMYGDLLVQKWNGQLSWANLNATGDAIVDSTGKVITNNLPKLVTSAQGNHVGTGVDVANGLDVLLGPGGAIVGIDYSDNTVTVALPDDISVTATSMVAYDIFPWRAPAAVGGREFVIGGSGFGNLSNTSVQFGDLVAQITEVSNNRIYGIIPQDPTPTNELLDITVTVDTKISIIPDAFRYLV